MPTYACHIPTADEGACIVLHQKKLCTVEWKLGAWLWAVGWCGFCPLGHEGSCQLLSIRVSTAVTRQLSLRLSQKILSSSWGNVRIT
jgi:hypothetical protein